MPAGRRSSLAFGKGSSVFKGPGSMFDRWRRRASEHGRVNFWWKLSYAIGAINIGGTEAGFSFFLLLPHSVAEAVG